MARALLHENPMPADFPNFDPPELPRQRVRPPIDYRSRNAKVRLFGAVAAVILVLALAERARDPASWNWLFGLKSKSVEVEKPIDNRMARTETPPSDPEMVFLGQENEQVLPRQGAGDDNTGKSPSQPSGEKAGLVHDSWKAAWTNVWADLGSDERTLLFRLVEAAQDNAQFVSESSGRAEAALETIDGLWTSYQSAAFQEFSALPRDEQTSWIEALRQVNARWLKVLKPALQLVALGGSASAAEQKTIAEFQRDLEQLCLTQVRDDATFLRPDENQIWFHLLHELQIHRPADLKKKSVGTVGYGAMYNQPEAYRGKVVTVRAQVRWAERRPAIKNYLGIKEFNVLYLAPEGVPDKPLIVYSLALPPGFPPIQQQSHPSGMTKLYEDVVVTGYFFKRGAYRGKDANYTAPLILANSLDWTPAQGRQETFAKGEGIWRETVLIAVVVFVVAAIGVYFVTRRGPGEGRRFDSEQVRASVAELKNADLPPTLQESLKRLAEEGREDAN
jgi:hypothetical protein